MAYKIIYDKDSCIGAGECEAISKKFWKVDRDGRAILNGAKLNEETGNYELIIGDGDLKEQEVVVGSCPIACIKLEKMKE
ncbi:ferredoxin [Candidatus Woesearchaeota archaeon]|nr:ferredoxin [Candidatus Woesearchaeota archaeon]MCF7901558.1 ferredoxin [Candidatus Woesearchaeota archaeon]MCF8013330.1 ferredoxin [Candidatus Woesearchaeota archaeon]